MVGEEAIADQAKQEMVPLAEAGKNWRKKRETEALWYAVKAREDKDWEVCLAFAKLDYECERFVRKVSITRRVMVQGVEKRETTWKKIPLFSPYVFVCRILTPSFRNAVGGMPDVEGFLCYAGSEEPASIDESIISFYRDLDAPSRAVDDDMRPDPSDIVRVIVGPATGVIGMVKSVSKAGVRIESRGKAWSGPIFALFSEIEIVERGKGASLARASGSSPRKASKHANA